MASRFPNPRPSSGSSLFAGYDAQVNRGKSHSPATSSRPSTNGYAIHPKKSDDAPRSNPTSAFGAYPTSNPYSYTGPSSSSYNGPTNSSSRSSAEPGGVGYRAATPNSRGQYSDAVLSSLEDQNEEELQGMTAKVRMLKDLTSAIGDEIRDSTAFAEKLNLNFENASVRLKGTMNRMLRMAQKTGVGWRVWVGFFAAVVLLFYWVWLF